MNIHKNTLIFTLIIMCFSNSSVFAQEVKILKLPVSDVIYVPQKDKLYASFHKLRDFGNSYLYTINPYTGVIEDKIQIGYQINKLAVTEDGKYLYLAEYGNVIYRYDLTTKKIDLTINLGFQASRPDSLITLELKVMPQKNNTIGVIRGFYSNSGYTEDIAIFENEKLVAVSERNQDFANFAFAKNSDYIYTSSGYKSMYMLQRKGSNLETIRLFSDMVGLDKRLKEDDEGYLYGEAGGLRIDVKNIFPFFEGHFKPRPEVPNGHSYTTQPHYQTEPNSNFMYTISYENLSQGSQSYLSKFMKNNYLVASKQALPLNPNFTYYRKFMRFGFSSFVVTTDVELVIIRDCTPSVSTPPTIEQGVGITLCRDSFLTISATPGYAHYFWTTGDTGRTIKIKYAVTNPSSFPVWVSVSQQEKACMSNYSKPIYVNTLWDVGKHNIVNDEYKKDITICQGDSVVLFSISSVQKGILWSNGATTEQLIVKKSEKFTARAVSITGCIGEPSDSVKVTVRPEPAPPRPPINLVGDSSICQGEQITFNTTTGYTTYEWENNATNSAQLKVSPFSQTKYRVRVTDNVGCKSGWSESKTINVSISPVKPFITVNDKSLAASSVAESYQWFLNDIPIAGATNQIHIAKATGKYTVQAYNRKCSSPISIAVSIVL
jgi:hypothetical protein